MDRTELAARAVKAPTPDYAAHVLLERTSSRAASSAPSRGGCDTAIAGAGGVIATVGAAPAFAVNAASFVASAALIMTLHLPPHSGQVGAALAGCWLILGLCEAAIHDATMDL